MGGFLFFEIGGIIGMLIVGYLFVKVFKNFKFLINVVFLVVVILLLVVYWFILVGF